MKKRNLLFIFIIAIIIILSLIYLYFNNSTETVNNTEQASSYETDSQNKSKEFNFYPISDYYGVDGNEAMSEMFGENNSLERLKNFNKELNEKFDYYELNFQPLSYFGYYDNDKIFADDEETINQSITLEDNTNVNVTALKAMQISQKIYSNFNNNIEAGRNFNDDDFQIKDINQDISIILGYEYLKYYNIGDTIALSLHEKNINFKVIGFYKKDTSVNISGSVKSLDSYIIMPSYYIDYDSDISEENKYQKIFYSQKNSGFIKNNGEQNFYDDSKKLIDEISEKYNLKYSLINSAVTINY